MRDRYAFPAILTIGADGVSVEFPDLPGCLTCGSTVEEAIGMAEDALALHLWGLEDDGDPIPAATTIPDLKLASGEVPAMISVWMPPVRDEMAMKAIKKTLTIPRWLNDLAESKGLNFSGILQTALKRQLGVNDPPAKPPRRQNPAPQ